MHKGCRTVLAVAAASLALAPTAAADTATSDLYVARDACGGTDPANLRLAPEVGPYTGNCGNLLGVLGGSPSVYPSETMAPVSLDAERPVYIAISTTSEGVAVGDQTIDVELTAKDKSKEIVTLGEASNTKPAAEMLRGGTYTAEFELPISAEQAAKQYTAFTLTLTVGGSALGGYVNHGGQSLVSLPVFDSDE
jgi:hypothetical protein